MRGIVPSEGDHPMARQVTMIERGEGDAPRDRSSGLPTRERSDGIAAPPHPPRRTFTIRITKCLRTFPLALPKHVYWDRQGCLKERLMITADFQLVNINYTYLASISDVVV